MAVDKEAIICLSRVYSYYFMCNFPLFYVYPALTRYVLSIQLLNILTLLACTQSSDNLFHTLMVLCENKKFIPSNLLCFFTIVKLSPLYIYSTFFNFEKEGYNQYFHNHLKGHCIEFKYYADGTLWSYPAGLTIADPPG